MDWTIFKDLPAVAMLGGMCYLMLRTFLGQVNSLTKGSQQRMTCIERSIDANTLAILALHDTLLRHDLTVSGLNPSAGADVDERTNKAVAKYEAAHKAILDVQRLIMKSAGFRLAEDE